mgnify:CR=1 FL=1
MPRRSSPIWPTPQRYVHTLHVTAGFVCFVINPCVLSANRVDLGFFCLCHKFSNFIPPPPLSSPLLTFQSTHKKSLSTPMKTSPKSVGTPMKTAATPKKPVTPKKTATPKKTVTPEKVCRVYYFPAGILGVNPFPTSNILVLLRSLPPLKSPQVPLLPNLLSRPNQPPKKNLSLLPLPQRHPNLRLDRGQYR